MWSITYAPSRTFILSQHNSRSSLLLITISTAGTIILKVTYGYCVITRSAGKYCHAKLLVTNKHVHYHTRSRSIGLFFTYSVSDLPCSAGEHAGERVTILA